MGNEFEGVHQSGDASVSQEQIVEDLGLAPIKKLRKEYQMEKHLASTKPGNFKQTDRYASQLSMLANRNEHQIIEDVDLINEDIQNCKLKDKKHICTRKTISAYN